MDRYIGLDVHMQSCTMAVMGPTGRRLREEVIATNGGDLLAAIRKVEGQRHLCMEEGTQSEWLYELLEPEVDELVVTVPGASRGQKSDALDAWARADELRQGAVKTKVFKAAAGQYTELRHAVRGYRFMVQDMTRAKNRLKTLYRSRGISGMKDEIYDEARRGPWLAKLEPSQRKLAELIGEQLDRLVELVAQAKERLEAAAGEHRIVRRLATAPGLGTIRAAQVVATVVAPERFRTSRQFWSYCGLGIETQSSADWVREGGRWVRSRVQQTRGLNRNRNAVLKSVFKGAAKTVTTRMTDHPLYRAHQALMAAGTKPNLAELTIARRIAAAVLAMWKHQEDYDPGKQEAKPQTR